MSKTNWSTWVEEARKSVGWTQTRLGEETGLSQVKLSNIKRGIRDLSADEARSISAATGFPLPEEGEEMNVLGYVGAGAEVFPIDDGDPMHKVVLPLPKGSVGAIIRGDSMFPIFEDGDLVAYSGETVEPESALGTTCIVQVADGRMLIKTVRRGSEPGLYTLTSANAPDIEDVELDWAREFIMRMPRKFWHRYSRV